MGSVENVENYLANQDYDYPDDDVKDRINRGLAWDETFRKDIKGQERTNAKSSDWGGKGYSEDKWKNFKRLIDRADLNFFGKKGGDKLAEYEGYYEQVKEIPVRFREFPEEWFRLENIQITEASTLAFEEGKISRIVTSEEERKDLSLREKQIIGNYMKRI